MILLFENKWGLEERNVDNTEQMSPRVRVNNPAWHSHVCDIVLWRVQSASCLNWQERTLLAGLVKLTPTTWNTDVALILIRIVIIIIIIIVIIAGPQLPSKDSLRSYVFIFQLMLYLCFCLHIRACAGHLFPVPPNTRTLRNNYSFGKKLEETYYAKKCLSCNPILN